MATAKISDVSSSVGALSSQLSLIVHARLSWFVTLTTVGDPGGNVGRSSFYRTAFVVVRFHPTDAK